MMKLGQLTSPFLLEEKIPSAVYEALTVEAISAKHINDRVVDLYFGKQQTDKPDRRRLPDSSLFPRLLEKSMQSRSEHIYYLFKQLADIPAFTALKDQCRSDLDWRGYDDLLSVALPGSKIHAHIDLIDVLIVQLEGERLWQIWPQELNPEDCLSLNINADVKPYVVNQAATFEVLLKPGEMLYIPALYPHSASCDDGLSTSASIGWTSITAFRLIHWLLADRLSPQDKTDLIEDTDAQKPLSLVLKQEAKPEVIIQHLHTHPIYSRYNLDDALAIQKLKALNFTELARQVIA